MTNDDLQLILELLHKNRRLDFSHYDKPLTVKSIKAQMALLGVSDPKQYVNYLEKDEQKIDDLLDRLTINVSQFFRNPLVFEFMHERILPEFINNQTNTDKRTIRIWSAGCANGEEAYSTAILFETFFRQIEVNCSFKVFATDIDHNALETSLRGIYRYDALKNVRYSHLINFFEPVGETFRIKRKIAQFVEFSYHDLTGPKHYAPPASVYGNFDVVLCRNVLIYYSGTSQDLILSKCIRALKPGGFLILGESEIPTPEARSKLKQLNDCCKIFKKK